MTPAPAFDLWVYLAASPLLWLTLTIGVFLAAQRVAKASGYHAVVNPVLITIVVVVLVLQLTGTSYDTYFDGAQFIHFILGPATVALAVPLYRSRKLVHAAAVPIIATLMVGGPFAILSATGIAALLGASREIILALVPKSVTAGIAVGIAGEIGGEPALTAIMVIATGILGAVIVTPLMNALKMTDYAPHAVLPPALLRMVSARCGRFRSTRWLARLPALPWQSTALQRRWSLHFYCVFSDPVP